ncbi:hypothetical protein C0995_007791, partial [Termitomyces sp. Mi166
IIVQYEVRQSTTEMVLLTVIAPLFRRHRHAEVKLRESIVESRGLFVPLFDDEFEIPGRNLWVDARQENGYFLAR